MELIEEHFWAPNEVESLTLSFAGLHLLPVEVAALNNLKSLTLNGNQLESLPSLQSRELERL